MTPASQTDVVTLFGDLEQGIWGVAVGDQDMHFSLASFDGDEVSCSGPLTVTGANAGTSTLEDDHALGLCRVRGSLNLDGHEREFDLPGVRQEAVGSGKLGAIRLVGAWLGDGRELALSAARPRNASGQDKDTVRAVVAGESHPLIFDPRLSTTCDQQGTPRRVGLELWLADDEDGDQFPRRVAAEATGAALTVQDGHSPVQAFALRCHSHGQVGAGVYALLKV